VSLVWVAVALATLGAIRGDPAPRARLLLGALLIGLASASLVFVIGADYLSPSINVGVGGDGVVFLQVVAGFVLLGVGLGWTAGVWLPMLAVTIAAGLSVRILFGFTGWLRPIGIAAAVLALAVLGWLLIAWLRPGRLLIALDRGLLDSHQRSAWRPSAGWMPTGPILATAAAAVLALVIPHLWTVLGGATVALLAGWVATRRAHRSAWILLPGALLIALGLLWSVRLSGPLGGWIPTLIDGPFSPRAAQALALLIGLAAAVVAGIWPLHRLSVPILLAPVAVAVSGTFAVLLIPDGVQWWQPIFAPLALIGMAHAIAVRRSDQLLVAMGMYGLWTGTRLGALGGALLIGAGWVGAVAPSTWMARLPVSPLVARLALLVPAAGAMLVQRGGIATETGYAVLFTAVVAVAITVFVGPPAAASVAPAR